MLKQKIKKAVPMPKIQLTEKYFMTKEEALNNDVKLQLIYMFVKIVVMHRSHDIVNKDILWGDFTFWSGQTEKMQAFVDVANWTQKFC